MASSRFRLHDTFDDCFGVFEPCEHFFSAAVLFDETKFKCAVVAFLVYVRDCAHYGTNNYFRVIMKKVNLERNFRKKLTKNLEFLLK